MVNSQVKLRVRIVLTAGWVEPCHHHPLITRFHPTSGLHDPHSVRGTFPLKFKVGDQPQARLGQVKLRRALRSAIGKVDHMLSQVRLGYHQVNWTLALFACRQNNQISLQVPWSGAHISYLHPRNGHFIPAAINHFISAGTKWSIPFWPE